MAVKIIGKLVGQIDCSSCLTLLEWDSESDIKVQGTRRYIVCPKCGQHVELDPNIDYWITKEGEEEDEGGDTPSGNSNTAGEAVVGTAQAG